MVGRKRQLGDVHGRVAMEEELLFQQAWIPNISEADSKLERSILISHHAVSGNRGDGVKGGDVHRRMENKRHADECGSQGS